MGKKADLQKPSLDGRQFRLRGLSPIAPAVMNPVFCLPSKKFQQDPPHFVLYLCMELKLTKKMAGSPVWVSRETHKKNINHGEDTGTYLSVLEIGKSVGFFVQKSTSSAAATASFSKNQDVAAGHVGTFRWDNRYLGNANAAGHSLGRVISGGERPVFLTVVVNSSGLRLCFQRSTACSEAAATVKTQLGAAYRSVCTIEWTGEIQGAIDSVTNSGGSNILWFDDPNLPPLIR